MFLYDVPKYIGPCVVLLLIVHQEILFGCRWSASAQVLHQGCLAKCGEIDIPYPFGTTLDCYLNSDFFVNCIQKTSGQPQLFFRNSDSVEVTNISRDGQLTILSYIGKDCYFQNGEQNIKESQSAMVTLGHNFPFSTTQNKFIAIGCDTIASIVTVDATTGCSSRCGTQTLAKIKYDGSCSGLGCCQTTIPENLLAIDVSVTSFKGHIGIWDYNPCSYTFLAANDYFTFSEGDLYNLKNRSRVPTVLDWAIGDSTCAKHADEFACPKNTECVDSSNGPGYRCSCLKGYEGNPYMPQGCQDINECALSEPCGSDNICTDEEGGFKCSCKAGFIGTAKLGGGGCTLKPLEARIPIIQITVGIAVGLAAFLFAGSWVYWGYSKRKHLQLKQKFFEQNGGLMLRKELSTKEGYSDTARIFTANELEKATNNFDESKIIGRGGFGTVYKGILEDGRLIAIKKSKVMDEDQTVQFINEVIVLSQINHRNVVRLLGCCLETEVPLLVYEYISNGTLHEHIHEINNPSDVLSWENRLKIASEIAGVLAYLHSEASVPIVHRDVKCTNILLDENYTAKVSDFGASRLVPVDKDTLSTMVQGTIGYLDPEYLHTSQLTDKSDVYSFGVVLAELITGKKALAFDRPEEERCLAMMFIISMKNEKLFSVIENGLVNEGNRKQIEEAANLALACLRVIGDERPSMREVASELHGLFLTGKHSRRDPAKGSEENEHLLGCQQLLDGYDPSCSTTGFYNSITDDFVSFVGDAR